MNKHIHTHVNKVIDQISHLYKSSYRLRWESVEMCKQLDTVVSDRDIIVAGFLSNFHKLLIKPDNKFEVAAQQLRIYGFGQNVTTPILLLKYIGQTDPMAQIIKENNQWYFHSQIIHNTNIIVQNELKHQSPHTKLDAVAWHKYLSEVYSSLYRSSLGK